MVIQVNISNKVVYFLVTILALVTVTGVVIAWGSGNPQLHGHDAGEVEQVGTNFGEWVEISRGPGESDIGPFQAQTSGLVIASAHYAYGINCARTLIGITDSSPNPTINRAYAKSSYDFHQVGSFTMPVKKGDYWKITQTTVGSITCTEKIIYWIPTNS